MQKAVLMGIVNVTVDLSSELNALKFGYGFQVGLNEMCLPNEVHHQSHTK